MSDQARQTSQVLSAQDETAHETFVASRLLGVHTAIPAIVQSYNAATKTIEAQPAVKRILADGTAINLPLCVDVPVCFPGGGGFITTTPIAQGDECLLIFSERSIDSWWQSGGVQLPTEHRMHDLSDAFAIVGPLSRPKATTFTPGNGCETWYNGSKLFSIATNGDVTIAGKLTVTGEVTGNGKELSTHVHAAGDTPGVNLEYVNAGGTPTPVTGSTAAPT